MNLNDIISLKEKEFSENGKHALLPQFIATKPIQIETEAEAQELATHLGNLVMAKMADVRANMTQEAQNDLEKSLNWIHKKATIHPAEVLESANAFNDSDEFLAPLEKLGISRAQALTDLKITCILHDIGRLGEMDLATGLIVKLSDFKGKGYDHSFESGTILKDLGFDRAEIALPVKYHGISDFENTINQDEAFLALDEVKKAQVLAYGYALRDCDRIGNFIPKSVTGIKGCSELRNPAYVGNYRVTDSIIERVCAHQGVIVKEEKTYLDAMVRWVSWSYQMRYDVMKKELAPLIHKLWDRIFEEADEEYQNALEKMPLDYADTLEKLLKARKASMQFLHAESMLDESTVSAIKAKTASLKNA